MTTRRSVYIFMHHPLYSYGRYHGPEIDLKTHLEPLFEKHGVHVAFSWPRQGCGRLKPEYGIQYFVLGNLFLDDADVWVDLSGRISTGAEAIANLIGRKLGQKAAAPLGIRARDSPADRPHAHAAEELLWYGQ